MTAAIEEAKVEYVAGDGKTIRRVWVRFASDYTVEVASVEGDTVVRLGR